MIINFKKLAKTPLRKKALQIAEAGYEAIDIEKAVPRRIKKIGSIITIEHIFPYDQKTIYEETKLNLNDFERIFVVGIGKGSALTSLTLARIIGNKLTKAICLDIRKPDFSFWDRISGRKDKIETYAGTHPLPSEVNIKATGKIIELAKNLTKKDLLITIICGGGSALACASESELNASITATRALTKAGADITALNIVRKHLSEFKAGGLAKMSCPATLVSLIVSDVCGNDLSMVSSGPTVLDKTTKADAENIIRKYGLNPIDFQLIETPKGEEYFERTKNILLVCNQDAVMAMLGKAKELGFYPKIMGLDMQGEAKKILLPFISEIKPGETIIVAGETTVNLGQGKIGKGGRNLEVALGALEKFPISNSQFSKDMVVASIASDGRDNTEAAGAIVDHKTLEKAKSLGLDIESYLNTHSTFEFFEKTGDLIFTELRSFNVADLMLVLRSSK